MQIYIMIAIFFSGANPAFRYNLFLAEKARKRIFAAIGARVRWNSMSSINHKIKPKSSEVVTDTFEEATDWFEEITDMFEAVTDWFEEATDWFEEITDGFEAATDTFEEITDWFEEATDWFEAVTDGFEEFQRVLILKKHHPMTNLSGLKLWKRSLKIYN